MTVLDSGGGVTAFGSLNVFIVVGGRNCIGLGG